MPQSEHRITLPDCLAEVKVPLPNNGWIQIVWPPDGVKLLARQLVHLEHGGEVSDALTAQPLGEFIAFLPERLFQLIVTLAQTFQKICVTLVLLQFFSQLKLALRYAVDNVVTIVLIHHG